MSKKITKEMRIAGYSIFLGLCLVTIAFQRVEMSNDEMVIEILEKEIEKQEALREQAEQIRWKLIEEKADDWCEDTVEELVSDLDDCEWGRMRFDCDECWSLVGYLNEHGEDQMETFCSYRYLDYDERALKEAKHDICQ